MTPRTARGLHLVVAVVATAALVLQLVLVLTGSAVLDETNAPPLGLAVFRYFVYFTIQSNILVAVTAWLLVRDPGRDGRWFRPVRLAALVGITVTGLVHFFLLRPLLDLDGADWLTDKLLHVAVPLLAVVVWGLVGPRPRASVRAALEALVWPVAWTVYTLVYGAVTGWYPYPFLDHRENGVGTVVVACLGITVLFLALFAAYVALDGRLRPTPDAAAPVSAARPAR